MSGNHYIGMLYEVLYPRVLGKTGEATSQAILSLKNPLSKYGIGSPPQRFGSIEGTTSQAIVNQSGRIHYPSMV